MLSRWRSRRLSGWIGGMKKGSTKAWDTKPRPRLKKSLGLALQRVSDFCVCGLGLQVIRESIRIRHS